MQHVIVFLSANPSGTARLELDEEYHGIDQAWQRAKLRDAFDLRAALAVTIDDVRDQLARYHPAVFHFSGHGLAASGEAGGGRGALAPRRVPTAVRGELALKGKDGGVAPVPLEPLAEEFRLWGGSVRCVVLNACHTEAQARAISAHVDCAIGTSGAVPDEAAIAFAKGFHRRLCEGGTFQEAFDAGRNGVDLELGKGAGSVYVRFPHEPGKSERLPLAEAAPPPFHVPFPRNETFVGRDESLARLHAMLRAHRTAGVRPAMLTGMGGIGKTQLAVAYAHAHRAEYPGGIYWVNAAGADWRPALAELAAELRLPVEGDGERQARLVAAFAAHVGARPDALVIFDNVDDPVDLATPQRAGFVPGNLGCRLLFTTRRRDAGGRFDSIEVTVLPAEAALDLLLSGEKRRALRDRVRAGTAPADRETARAIARALGWLPLALVLAAAYLDLHDEIPLPDYAVRLREEGLLQTVDVAEDAADAEAQRRATLATRHDDAVGATLRISWDAIRGEHARAVLETAALLGEAAAIPRARLALLTGLGEEPVRGRPAPLKKALDELHRLSLVEELTAEGVRLHPLVREFAAGQLDRREDFAADRAGNLGEALWDLERLDDEVRARGVDAVLGDLRVGVRLSRAGEAGWLQRLVRPLDREAHCLRRWMPAERPEFLLQQMRNQCFQRGEEAGAGLAEQGLAKRGLRYLRARVRCSRESEVLIRTLEGHTDEVRGVALTSDGLRAVSASGDKTLKVWDVESGEVVRTLEGHTEGVNGVALTSDGLRAVSASEDKTLKVWDVESGEVVRTLEGHTEGVNGVALTLDGLRAVSASKDKTLKVWNVESGEVVRTLKGHTEGVNGVALTSDGLRAVSASRDHTLKVWNVESGEVVRTLEGHTNWVWGEWGVALTSDGLRAVSASEDHTLKVWDLESGEVARTLEGHTNWVMGVALTSDGLRAVSASEDHTLKAWDVESGEVVRTLEGHTAGVWGVALTSDGLRAVSASEDHTLKAWDVESGEVVRTLEGHTAVVWGVALTSDGLRAVSASEDQTLKVWDVESSEVVRTLEDHTDWVRGVALTSDGLRAVSASDDHTLKVWDVESGEVVRTLEGHTNWVMGVALTSDGLRAVSASYDKTLKVWDVESGEVARTLEGHTNLVMGVALTSDGLRAVSASGDKTLKVWDVESGEVVRTLEGHTEGVNGVALTSDGLRAVSASEDKTLKVWDVGSGEVVRTLKGHTGAVNGVAVTSDGRWACSASDDRTLRVWDLASGRTVATLEAHAPLTCCVVTSGGRILAGDSTGALHILDWHTPPSSAVLPRAAAPGRPSPRALPRAVR